MNKQTFHINHKAAMDDTFRPAKTRPACHVCRHAVSPTKPGKPFTCRLALTMDASHCASFHDARRSSFDASKILPA